MSSLFGILNTGRLGLMANQGALAVTGSNIANVNTVGYSRQRVEMESLSGGGVQVGQIERMRDEYLTARLQDATSSLGGGTVRTSNLQSLESLLNETEDSGLSKTIRDFFNTFQDLSLQPGGTTEREMARSRGVTLAQSLGNLASQVREVRSQLDGQITASVDRINTLTSEIAQINQKIADLSGGGTAQQVDLNAVLDRRDQLLNELAEFVPLHVVKDSRGLATVFGGGEVLVEGTRQYPLATVADPSNDGLHAVGIREADGTLRPLSGTLSEGSLGGMLQVRDGEARQTLNDIDRLSAELIRTVNSQHRAGSGLDGVSGRDFFQGLAASANAERLNQGGAKVSSAAITDPSQLTFDDYEIRFTAAGQFDIVDTTTGTTLSSNNGYVSGGAINFGGMTVVLGDGTGAPQTGDVFRVNAYTGSASRMSLSAAVAADTRAIAAGTGGATGDNSNALALAALLEAPVMGHPASQTFEDFYHQTQLGLGLAVQNAETQYADAAIIQQQVQGLVDQLSSVSIDEEATLIIQYQRAFEASSRVVRVTDELLQSILNMI